MSLPGLEYSSGCGLNGKGAQFPAQFDMEISSLVNETILEKLLRNDIAAASHSYNG